MNPTMFLMGSTPGSSTKNVRPRSTAHAVANSAGVGANETFSYTPSASGWYGLVVVNERSSGAVDLTRTGGAAGAPVPAK